MPKANVEAQQSMQFVSDGHRIRSFQAIFRDALECSNYRSEKETLITIDFYGREGEERLKKDLGRIVTLCFHISFCRNGETNVGHVPCCKQRLEEQKCWWTAFNSVRMANDVFSDTETECAGAGDGAVTISK